MERKSPKEAWKESGLLENCKQSINRLEQEVEGWRLYKPVIRLGLLLAQYRLEKKEYDNVKKVYETFGLILCNEGILIEQYKTLQKLLEEGE